jgi:hypothetical protein
MSKLEFHLQTGCAPIGRSPLLRSLSVSGAVCLAVCGASAAPQSLLEVQGQALLGPGTVLPIPGSPAINVPIPSLWTAARADDGSAILTLPENPNSGGGLYAWSQAAGLTRLLGPGSPIVSGAPLATTIPFQAAISPGIRVSANGRHVLFGTGLQGSFTTESNDSALYVLSNGTVGLLVREGLLAPGTQGATVVTDLKQQLEESSGVDETGLACFRVRLAFGDVLGPLNDEILYRGTPGNLAVAAREGDALPGGELLSELIAPPPFGSFRQVFRLGQQGTLLFSCRLLQGQSSLPLSVDNDQAILLSRPGQALSILVREGDAAPFAGTTFGGPQGDWNRWTGMGPVFDGPDTGLQFLTSLVGGVGAPGGLEALVQVRQSGSIALARVGDPLPQLPGVFLTAFETPLFHFGSSGRAAFFGKLGGAVGAGNDSALLAVTPGGPLEVIAREGDVAPGTGGKLFLAPSNLLGVDSLDRIWFRADVQLGAGGPTGGRATWVHQADVGLRAAAFGGDELPAPSGQTIKGSEYALSRFYYTTTGRPTAITDDGVALMSMTGGSGSQYALVNVATRSLSASVPSLSASAGGTIELPLQSGSDLGGQVYLTLGTLSGASPGIPTDAGVLPLNPDFLTDAMLIGANQGPFQQNLGQLTDLGVGPARVLVPQGSNSLAGLTATFAGLVLDVQGVPRVTFVTDSTAVLFLP